MSPESPLDATGIARRQFSTVRKGYDPTEVRAFLNELSEVVARIQREEAHEHERAERAETRAHLAEQLDEHRLVELLGEETARVLEAAREASAGIRSKAEESAARMVREAQAEARALTDDAEREAGARRTAILSEADALRREAEDEVERRRVEGQVVADDLRRAAEAERDEVLAAAGRARAEADAAAEQIRAAARDQGRRLVGEAHVVRERILADLARRRRVAREQLERLNGARERLLAAYEVVRRTVDEATGELRVALPEARVASEAAVRRVRDEPEESVDVIEAELSVARMSGDDAARAEVSDDELDAMLRELAEEEAAQAAARAEVAAEVALEAEADEAADDLGVDVPGDVEPSPPSRAAGATGDAGPAGTGEPSGGRAPTGSTPEPDAAPVAEATAADGAVTDAGASGVPAASPDSAAPMSTGPRASAAGGEPSSSDQSDAERWGVRLPRSSRRRAPVAPVAEAGPGLAAGDPRPAPATLSGGATASPAALGEEPDEGETGPYVDELFARIRAERGTDPEGSEQADPSHSAVAVMQAESEVAVGDQPASEVTDADAADAAVDVDAEPPDPSVAALRARDDLLAAIERELGRRLKRVLADEQNQVLDTLRRGGTVDFVDVLPVADEHADRYAIAAVADLDSAARHGAEVAGGATGVSCDELAGELGRTLVDPLRRRVERSFTDADGDYEEVAERLRSLYREWKGQHIGRAVRHYTSAAWSVGTADAVPKGEAQRWLVDASCEACPDCDDNALAGAVPHGEAFPTGDVRPPAHEECRCIVVAVSRLDER